MNHPVYLWKNERGIYFFRARIPKQFLEYFIGTEIKKSLKTDSLRQAVKLARAYRVELDKELDKLKPGEYGAFEVTLKAEKVITFPNGETKTITGEIKRNLSSLDEDTTQHKEYLLNQLEREVKHQTHEAREEALFNAKLSTIAATPAPTSTPPDKNARYAALSDIINEFVNFKVTSGDWNANPKDTTHSQGVAKLNLFLEILSNKQSSELSVLDAIKIEETLPLIPKNPNKGALAKLPNLQAKLDTDATIHPRLAKRTASKYWETFKELTKFAKQKKYTAVDITEDCVGIKFSKKDGKAAQWRKLTNNDLQNIFNGHIYQPEKKPRSRNHDYHFWLPLLAAYAGGRINELCQLLLTDIKQYEGIYYIHITDEDEEGRKVDGKNVKSEAGKRRVPLHKTLINLGFLDFINQPRSGDFANMIFTTGLQNHEGKKWGKNASNWFNGYEGRDGYKQMCGIPGNDKKVFHSFRKSFAANLINLKFPKKSSSHHA
jgi:integrase